MKIFVKAVFAVILLGTASLTQAHVSFVDFGTDPTTTQSYTGNSFKRYGWIAGTDPALGDSHQIGPSSAKWFRFTLTSAANVDISFTQGTAGLDPAFTLYKGAFNLNAHDDTPEDPIQAADANGTPQMSPADHAPGDPNIAHYLYQYDSSGNLINLTLNPAWNETFVGSGGLTAQQWYAANYTPHNGYRDTLNGTTNGGIDTNPADANFGGLTIPYLGQFDALGNWSMADPAGNISSVQYLAAVSGFTGNGNHNTTVGSGESLLGYFLNPGTYSIAASGEACDSTATSCTGGFYKGTVSLAVHSLSAVPLPSAVWLLGSSLAGLFVLRRKPV